MHQAPASRPGLFAWSIKEFPISGRVTKFYPEYLDYPQRRPVGALGQDQRHRARIWVGYDQPTPVGTVNLSVLHSFDSPQSYSAIGTIDASGRIAGNSFTGVPVNPGYTLSQLGTTHAYYFSKRGAFRLKDAHSTDIAINCTLPIWKLNLFFHGDVLVSSTTMRLSIRDSSIQRLGRAERRVPARG